MKRPALDANASDIINNYDIIDDDDEGRIQPRYNFIPRVRERSFLSMIHNIKDPITYTYKETQ